MRPWAFLATVFTARRGLLPLVVALALLSSGCTMKAYEGPELPRSEIAVIDRWHEHGGVLELMGVFPIPRGRHRTVIVKIAGKRPGGIQFHILPGQHTAKVLYQRYPDVSLWGITNYKTRDISIDFTAEAGHEYRIPAERRDERDWIWVEDVTTGKVVAGEKPPATPPE